MKNEISKEISLSDIANHKYEYTKKEYSESIQLLYNNYYPFLPNIIVINGNYYYQRGSHFILFPKSVFDAITNKLSSVTYDENANNILAENKKYAIRQLEMIDEVYDDLNKNNNGDV